MSDANNTNQRSCIANTNVPATAYSNASILGIALGFVLLASFVFAGRGIGASGAFAHVTGAIIHVISPSFLERQATLADRLPADIDLGSDWIVWQIIGVCIGAALSATLAGRWGRVTAIQKNSASMSASLAGGALMGLGARFAYGCTSGLALSGGALLATGAWLFISIAFGTAMLVTALARNTSRAAP